MDRISSRNKNSRKERQSSGPTSGNTNSNTDGNNSDKKIRKARRMKSVSSEKKCRKSRSQTIFLRAFRSQKPKNKNEYSFESKPAACDSAAGTGRKKKKSSGKQKTKTRMPTPCSSSSFSHKSLRTPPQPKSRRRISEKISPDRVNSPNQPRVRTKETVSSKESSRRGSKDPLRPGSRERDRPTQEEEQSDEIYKSSTRYRTFEPNSVIKIREKIAKRSSQVKKAHATEEVRSAEIVYPKKAPWKSTMSSKEGEVHEKKIPTLKTSYVPGYTPSDNIATNGTNNGQIMIEGLDGSKLPFWYNPNAKESKETTCKSDDEDSSPSLSAETFMEALMGNIDMVDVPEMTVRLNAYAPKSELMARDDIFFSNDFIFCNSLRNMLHLNDEKKDLQTGNSASKESDEKGSAEVAAAPKIKGIAFETSVMMTPATIHNSKQSIYCGTHATLKTPVQMVLYCLNDHNFATRLVAFTPSTIRLNSRL